jgi:hypothetical protein
MGVDKEDVILREWIDCHSEDVSYYDACVILVRSSFLEFSTSVTSSFMEGPFIHHRQQLPGIDTT